MQRSQIEVAVAGGAVRPRLDQLGRAFDPRAALAGTRLGPPPQPGEFPAGQVAAGRLRRRGPLLTSGPAFEVAGIATLVYVGRPAIELEDPRRHPVENVAIMGDDDQPTLERSQLGLQPVDRIHVEMVGGLVQDEQVRVGDQRPGQGDPLLLAAREFRGRSIQHVAETEPIERRFSPPALPDGVSHASLRELGDLVESRHRDLATPPHGPGLRLDRARDDRQERRLPGPVDSDDSQPVSRRNRHADVGEKRPVRPAHAHPLDVDEDHGRRLVVGRSGTT